MILLLICFAVPVALFAWKICEAASSADDQMEALFQERLREGEVVSLAVGDRFPMKEDGHAG